MPSTSGKIWRHTFGSERKTAKWRERGPSGFVADVIALQGVENLQDARRMFRARQYHLVISRQLLARSNETSTGIAVFRDEAPATTAVAFRRRLGVRVSGFRHFLPPVTKNEPPAITALRLQVFGKFLWIASLDIPQTCNADLDTDECRPYAPVVLLFTDWLASISTQSAPLVLLGRWPSMLTDRIKDVGLAIRDMTMAKSVCEPAVSGALLAVPKTASGKTARFSAAGPSKENPCVAIANMTVNLR